MPGEGVGEHAPDRDRQVGEAGAAGEEVGSADVGADGRRSVSGAAGTGEGEDDQNQSSRSHDLGDKVWPGHAVMRAERDGLATKYDDRRHGADDARSDLGRQIGSSSTPTHPTEGSVDERHHRVEMRSAHRPEHQDDCEKSERCSGGVLG